MANLSKFQLALLGLFGLFIVAGLIFLAKSRGSSSEIEKLPQTVVWGTIKEDGMNSLIKAFENNKSVKVTYQRKNQTTFDSELLEALANGQGPDAIITSDDTILRFEKRAYVVPFENYSLRTFKDTFIEGGEIFLSDKGVIAFPFAVDPLVMYWNRDTFSSAGIAAPPRFWDELKSLTEVLTKRNAAGNIEKSAVAFGEVRNVTNAKGIISALLLQAGDRIVFRSGGTVYPVLGLPAPQGEGGLPSVPAESVIRFYSEYANPFKTVYSWNLSLPASKNAFIAGDLALYFGFASELVELRDKNPNLNFDVALLPQPRGAKKIQTYGKIYGLMALNTSRSISNTLRIFGELTSPAGISALSAATNLPPVRRDLLGKPEPNAFREIFNRSALVSGSWLVPSDNKFACIFFIFL